MEMKSFFSRTPKEIAVDFVPAEPFTESPAADYLLRTAEKDDLFYQLKHRIHARLLEEINLKALEALDADEIRLAPSPVKMLPGETLTLEATAYKGGNSAGLITGLGGIAWKSDNDAAVRVSGPVWA